METMHCPDCSGLTWRWIRGPHGDALECTYCGYVSEAVLSWRGRLWPCLN